MAASHYFLETIILEMDLDKVVVETFSDENKKAMCIQSSLHALWNSLFVHFQCA